MLLESLGYLAPMLLCLQRFKGQVVYFNFEPMVAVAVLAAGRSDSDELATTVIRAARLVVAAIGCTMSSAWVPRRSDTQSIIVNVLTYNLTSTLSREELGAYLDLDMLASPPLYSGIWKT